MNLNASMKPVYAVAAALTLLIWGAFTYAAVANPVAARNQAFIEREIAPVQPRAARYEGPNWDFSLWHADILGKESLWRELIQPPPPPPPPPPSPPDIRAKLEGVQPTRSQVGDKVRIRTPGDDRGSYYAVGDKINGVTIQEIAREYVLFSMPFGDKSVREKLMRE